MERRYFPGTVFPERTTDTSASGSGCPLRIMSTVTYSTSAPASLAAPATARIMGEMYGGTPKAAGSSMYPSMTATLGLPFMPTPYPSLVIAFCPFRPGCPLCGYRTGTDPLPDYGRKCPADRRPMARGRSYIRSEGPCPPFHDMAIALCQTGTCFQENGYGKVRGTHPIHVNDGSPGASFSTLFRVCRDVCLPYPKSNTINNREFYRRLETSQYFLRNS